MNKFIKPLIILFLSTILIWLVFYIISITAPIKTQISSLPIINKENAEDTNIKWYNYNEEAFQTAIKEDKLIFLHITNPSCLECQFMQNNSFQNPDIINKMNKFFINIMVDNELRPDVFHIFSITEYIFSKTQGLPLNVILTPDFKPIFIISVTDNENLNNLFNDIENAWVNQRNEIYQQANQLFSITKSVLNIKYPKDINFPDKATIDNIYEIIKQKFETENSKFINDPRFFFENNLAFFLDYAQFADNNQAFLIAKNILDQIAISPMQDHLNGGFFNNSRGNDWSEPNLVKKLYNQIQLGELYLKLFVITNNPIYMEIVIKTLNFILNVMYDDNHGFYSAIYEDIANYGNSYLLSESEISKLNDSELNQFNQFFVLSDYSDHKDFTKTKIVSYKNLDALNVEAATEILHKIFKVKEQFNSVISDKKILTSWNSLMITFLVKASEILEKPEYLDIAETTFDLMTENNYRDNILYQTSNKTVIKELALFEDYSYLANAAISLFKKTQDYKYLNLAKALTSKAEFIFYDKDNFNFFANQMQKTMPRTKITNDTYIKSGNAVMANVLLDLYIITNQEIYVHKFKRLVSSFSPIMIKAPFEHISLWNLTIKYYQTKLQN
jgi:uncharacterized protein YyaL (SSP411 family)